MMRGGGHTDDEIFFSSRRRHTRYWRDWSSDVCSSDLVQDLHAAAVVVIGRGLHQLRYGVGRVVLDLDQQPAAQDRKSVVQGKSADLGGRRIIKKKSILPSLPLPAPPTSPSYSLSSFAT